MADVRLLTRGSVGRTLSGPPVTPAVFAGGGFSTLLGWPPARGIS
jgi:hypothetical protein